MQWLVLIFCAFVTMMLFMLAGSSRVGQENIFSGACFVLGIVGMAATIHSARSI